MVWGSGPVSFFCIRPSNFPKAIYWENYPFPIVYSWLFSHKLIDHICVGLFLGSLFCSIDLCVCFNTSTMLFSLLWPQSRGPQPFGHQGPVFWKTVFPRPRWEVGQEEALRQWGKRILAGWSLLLLSPVPNTPGTGTSPRPEDWEALP